MERPSWLPAMAPVEGPPEVVIPRLYQLFLADFEAAPRSFQGLPVRWDRRIVGGEVYEQGFWHLVSKEDQRARRRRFDPRRAERLPWCAPLLEHAEDPAVTVWDYREGHGRRRTYDWLERWDYVVVVAIVPSRAGMAAWLITAYHIGGPATERAFRRKYRQRLQQMQSPPLAGRRKISFYAWQMRLRIV